MINHITKDVIDALQDAKNTITPTEEDFAYFAGLIDSEGCFRIKKWKPKSKPNHVYNISLEIGNTKTPIMPWLIKRFGGSISYSPPQGKRKAVGRWCIGAKSLNEILPKIRPFLINKQEVCDKLISFHQTILPNGGDRHSKEFHELFSKRIAIREKIIEEVHALNRKGSH